MPNYTENLQLEQPLDSEQYDVAVTRRNNDKIDQFAGQTPARALTADKLTTGAKINGVNFKGDTDVVTGAGFYYDTVTYGAGDLAFIYNQNNGLELHKSLSAGNIGHNPITSTGYWGKVELGGSSLLIGTLLSSVLPLTDSGLHLLDGTRLSGDGSYAGFIDYIADLYDSGDYPDLFETEANWQQSVTTYGVCGKFVYDSVNNTVRLPKITGFVEGTTDINALGTLVEAGLPNITGGFGSNYFGNFYGACTYTGRSVGNSSGDNIEQGQGTFDASLSSSIYGNSTTVQPQAIKVLYYIVVATSTKTDIEVDIDEIASDLNSKADIDLTNVNNSGASRGAGWAMPSSTYVTFTPGASGTQYTMPANGWLEVRGVTTASNGALVVTNITSVIANAAQYPVTNGFVHPSLMPVSKNDIVEIAYTDVSIDTLAFHYAQGSESEAL